MSAALFGDDFDDHPDTSPVAEIVAQDVVVPKTYDTAYLEAACALAREEGRKAGLQEATEAQAVRVAELLSEIGAQWQAAQHDWITNAEKAASELADLIFAAMGAMMPALCARHGAAEITAVADEILPSLAQERVVRVQVAPENIGLLEPLIAGLDLGTDVHFRLTALDTLGPSDIRIRWHHGEALRSATDQWQRIIAIMAPEGFSSPTVDSPAKALPHVI